MAAFVKMKIHRSVFLLVAWLALPGWLHPDLQAQALTPAEYEMKAAFIYNFAKFVEWPDEAFAGVSAPLIIGLVGDDAFGDVLDRTVEHKIAQGRRLLVQRWRPNQGALRCHLLFISSSASKVSPEILKNIKGTAILTVGETDGFAQQGGMINFVLSGKKLNFEINHKNAESAGLKISSKLLTLAKAVWE